MRKKNAKNPSDGAAVSSKRNPAAKTTRKRAKPRRRAPEPLTVGEERRRVPATLAESSHVDQFFGQLLRSFTEQLNPVMSVLWMHRDTEVVTLALMLVDGRVLTPAQAAEHFPDYPLLNPFRVRLEDLEGKSVTHRFSHYHEPDIRSSPLAHDLIGQSGVDWYERHGVRQELNIPLVIGERTVGALSFYLSPEHVVTPEQVDLGFALAQQATLALELTRLAEAEKTAAIAREREQAAREQAAELTRTNETMDRSMAQLVSHNDLTGFLNTVLLEAIASAGAVSGVVFLYDQAQDALVQAAHVVRGKVIDVARDPDAAAFREPIPVSRNIGWDLLGEGCPVLWVDYESAHPAFLAEAAGWHHAMGHRFASAVPMMQDGRPIGLLAVAWDRSVETRPEESRVRVCQALARHATLAVRLTDLAEEARRAAVTSEREHAERERSADLARANEVLRRNLAVLAGAPQIDLFFDRLLRSFVDHFNPVMCNVWRTYEDGLVELTVMFVNGEALKLAEVVERFPDFPTPRPFRVPPEFLDGEPTNTRQRHYHFPDIRQAKLFHGLIGQAGIDWYVRRGVRQELNIPLHIGERGLGALSIYFDERHVIKPEQTELAFALAQQATLALELTRLADAEKAAAVSRERELAAQKRAAEQARINEALSRSIPKLNSHNDLTGFLTALVREVITYSGAVSGIMLLRDPAQGTVVQTVHVVRGQVLAADSDPIGLRFSDPSPAEGNDVFRMMREGRKFFWVDYADPVPAFWPENAAWHDAMGHRFTLGVAMMQDGEPIGLMGLAWDKSVETRPSEASLEICLALTQQASTAVQLTRLAEEAKAAAVFRERERVAQERAAQLERANAVLSHTIEAFAVGQSPEAFLNATLHAVVAALAVESVTMWRWSGDGYAHLHRVLEAGLILPGERADHPNAGRPSLISDDPWAQKILAAGTRTIEILNLAEHADTTGLTGEQVKHLRERGVRALVVAAIRSGSTTVGTFTARLREGQPDPDPDQISLLQSLAAQAAMALEMGRLTEAVRAGATREERTRIARDLHDSLAQGFTGIIVQLEAVGSALASQDLEKALSRAASASELARDSLRQASRAVHALRPSILENRDLATALHELIQATFADSSVEAEACFTGTSQPLPSETEEQLLRIVQEALTNVLRHASARHANVCLTYQPDEISLVIEDDGRGFDPAKRRPATSGGLGLVGIRERADRLGAALIIENVPTGGTRISVTLPTSGQTARHL